MSDLVLGGFPLVFPIGGFSGGIYLSCIISFQFLHLSIGRRFRCWGFHWMGGYFSILKGVSSGGGSSGICFFRILPLCFLFILNDCSSIVMMDCSLGGFFVKMFSTGGVF